MGCSTCDGLVALSASLAVLFLCARCPQSRAPHPHPHATWPFGQGSRALRVTLLTERIRRSPFPPPGVSHPGSTPAPRVAPPVAAAGPYPAAPDARRPPAEGTPRSMRHALFFPLRSPSLAPSPVLCVPRRQLSCWTSTCRNGGDHRRLATAGVLVCLPPLASKLPSMEGLLTLPARMAVSLTRYSGKESPGRVSPNGGGGDRPAVGGVYTLPGR